MNNLEWATLNEEPLRIVTPHGVKQWQEKRTPFSVSYELMERTDKGHALYRCRYQKQGTATPYLLVEPRADSEIKIRKLQGWESVQAHHAQSGDGRLVHLNHDETVKLT